MNKIINRFVLAGDVFMPEMHLKQPGFTYIGCEPFTKNKEQIQKFTETGDSSYIYQNKLHKVCFQYDRLMEILRLYLEKQRLTKYYVIKHLRLLNSINIWIQCQKCVYW